MLAVEVQRAMDENPQRLIGPAGVTKQTQALCSILTELVAVLGYQPSVPMDHKTDLMNALTEFKHAFGIK